MNLSLLKLEACAEAQLNYSHHRKHGKRVRNQAKTEKKEP